MAKILRAFFLPATAILLAAFVVWHQNRPIAVREATWNDVLGEARKGGYQIISTDQFWNLYRNDSDDLLAVDTRQEWEYRSGHIKGAVNFPMESTWRSRLTRRNELGKFLGPDRNLKIVFY